MTSKSLSSYLLDLSKPCPGFYKGPINGTISFGNGFTMGFHYGMSDKAPANAPNVADDETGYNAVVTLRRNGKKLDCDYRFAYLSDGEPSLSEKEAMFRDVAIEVIARNWTEMQFAAG